MGVMDLMEKEIFLEEANKKFCADCKTTKTPLWRGGPAGPKSLCNACGIRYRKRKASMVGMHRRSENKRDKTLSHGGTSSSSQRTISKSDENESENAVDDCQFQSKIVGYDEKPVELRKQASAMKKQRWQKQRVIGEEEEEEEEAAAVSLMALSCGSVFA